MVVVTSHDIDDWKAGLARALKASFAAMVERRPAAETAKLEQHIRALECEAQTLGFLSGDSARG